MKADFSELTEALRQRLSLVGDHEFRDRDPEGTP